jgi:hypothetical protein
MELEKKNSDTEKKGKKTLSRLIKSRGWCTVKAHRR